MRNRVAIRSTSSRNLHHLYQLNSGHYSTAAQPQYSLCVCESIQSLDLLLSRAARMPTYKCLSLEEFKSVVGGPKYSHFCPTYPSSSLSVGRRQEEGRGHFLRDLLRLFQTHAVTLQRAGGACGLYQVLRSLRRSRL